MEMAFKEKQQQLMTKFEELVSEYEKLTHTVSPKHWRTTGHHITSLKMMCVELKDLTEISKKESEIEWVKNQLNNKI